MRPISEISCSRKQQQQTSKWLSRQSNLGPFDYQAGALTTWLCCLTRIHTYTHIHTNLGIKIVKQDMNNAITFAIYKIRNVIVQQQSGDSLPSYDMVVIPSFMYNAS